MSHLYGDWKKLARTFNNLGNEKHIVEKCKDVFIEMGDRVAEQIKSNIENQSLPFPPLTHPYKERKVAQGYDPRILIKTGAFLDHIKVVDIQETDDSISVFIGVEDGITETGISMAELFEYIEYGTTRQPARLPVTMTWERIKPEIKAEIMNKLKVSIREAFS